MRMILIDSNEEDLVLLQKECLHASEAELVGCFNNPEDALSFASGHPLDFAMLEIALPGMDGITLAGKLRELHPKIVIIFVTKESQYTLDALKIKADYFVIKPFTSADIQDALRRARLLTGEMLRQVYIRAFGRFDVFAGDTLVKFTNAKSKELLALCVDHIGGTVSMEEAIDKLWEDKDYDSKAKALYRKAVICINATLKEYNIEDIFIHHRGQCHIDISKFRCDYYDYLKESREVWDNQDEYMFEYSWAEVTNAKLSYGKNYIK